MTYGDRRFFAVQGGLLQFRHRQCPESVGEWKTVRRAADDCTADDARFSHHLAHEIEVHGVALGRQFGPLGFEQFQTSADINHEVHLTRAIAPKEQAAGASGAAFAASQLSEDKGFPDGARRRRLTKGVFGTDIQQAQRSPVSAK